MKCSRARSNQTTSSQDALRQVTVTNPGFSRCSTLRYAIQRHDKQRVVSLPRPLRGHACRWKQGRTDGYRPRRYRPHPFSAGATVSPLGRRYQANSDVHVATLPPVGREHDGTHIRLIGNDALSGVYPREAKPFSPSRPNTPDHPDKFIVKRHGRPHTHLPEGSLYLRKRPA